MKTKAESLEAIKSDLEENTPQYTYRIGKRVYGQCIIAKKSNFSGADIYLKKDRIEVESAIPETWARIVAGSGAALMKLFTKDYSKPEEELLSYLGHKYESVKRKAY
ncbi:hypothetical protein H7F15_19090 [Pontibacter sp. Tf4]|uniref:hypothetical protein n=1 Tax=Pontibacter sp. Tf4 TaxID=2761620 RepID=UPI001627AC4F|nr:hypothetical protein [Pontibacter sp. Tf4]MBB6613153.1 hypothetical protein [Pontibacter sp. Tf4]